MNHFSRLRDLAEDSLDLVADSVQDVTTVLEMILQAVNRICKASDRLPSTHLKLSGESTSF